MDSISALGLPYVLVRTPSPEESSMPTLDWALEFNTLRGWLRTLGVNMDAVEAGCQCIDSMKEPVAPTEPISDFVAGL